MGFGAYYAADLSLGRLGVSCSSIIILITVPIVVGLIGFIFGLILFRLKGRFFVFATLGVVSIAFVFFHNNKLLFGGVNGIPGIPTISIGAFKFNTNLKWFYLLVALIVIGYIIVERIRNTKLGRSLASVKDNEIAALSLGVNVYMTKVIALTISAAFAGLAGSLYAMQSGFIEASIFNVTMGSRIIIMLALGGLTNTIGAVIGALVVSCLPEIFRSLKDFLNLAYGLAIILLMVFQPTGIAGMGIKIANLMKKISGCLKRKKYRYKAKSGGDEK